MKRRAVMKMNFVYPKDIFEECKHNHVRMYPRDKSELFFYMNQLAFGEIDEIVIRKAYIVRRKNVPGVRKGVITEGGGD